MADFVKSANVKSAVRELAEPIAHVAAFNRARLQRILIQLQSVYNFTKNNSGTILERPSSIHRQPVPKKYQKGMIP